MKRRYCIGALIVVALLVGLSTPLMLYSDPIVRGGMTTALANTLYCQLAGCTMTGPFKQADGLVSAPSYSFTTDGGNKGLYGAGTNLVGMAVGGAEITRWSSGSTVGFTIRDTYPLSWGSSGVATPDLFLTRRTTATLQQGGADAGVPVSQTLTAQGSRAGTDTDTAAPNWIIQAPKGTGTASGAAIDIRVATPQATGTSGHAAATALYLVDLGLANVARPQMQASGLIIPIGSNSNVKYVTADFTLAANTSLQTITGLTFNLPRLTAANYTLRCEIMYFQATAVVPAQFGIQTASFAATNVAAKADVNISASTFTAGNLPVLASTTATAIVTFTPSAITTIWNARITALIENPSNAAEQVVNIMAQTSNSADLLTVKRGSYCAVGF